MNSSNAKINLVLILGILEILSLKTVYAGQGQTNLTASINLIPACLVNTSSAVSGNLGSSLGELDFGQKSIFFDRANTTLINQFNAIKVYCPINSQVSLIFDAGQNSANVSHQNGLDRAMSNGAGKFVEYKIYKDNQSGMLLTPQTNLALSGGIEHEIKIYAEAYNNNNNIVVGQYTDQITITITF